MRTYARAEDELSKELLPRESHVLKQISPIVSFHNSRPICMGVYNGELICYVLLLRCSSRMMEVFIIARINYLLM